MAYALGNTCAKNLCKRTVLLQLIIENVVTCFFWNTVYKYVSLDIVCNFTYSSHRCWIVYFINHIHYFSVFTMNYNAFQNELYPFE